MKKVTVLVEIIVDEENIFDLYPNYRYNWNSPEEFIESRINDLETKDKNIVTGEPEDYLKAWGYKVRVVPRDEAKNMDAHLGEL